MSENLCKICQSHDNCFYESNLNFWCPTFKKKPPTNADRIRAMTDEELARFLFHSWNNAAWCHGGCDGECSCEPCWLYWLKQEVDE